MYKKISSFVNFLYFISGLYSVSRLFNIMFYKYDYESCFSNPENIASEMFAHFLYVVFLLHIAATLSL